MFYYYYYYYKNCRIKNGEESLANYVTLKTLIEWALLKILLLLLLYTCISIFFIAAKSDEYLYTTSYLTKKSSKSHNSKNRVVVSKFLKLGWNIFRVFFFVLCA